MFYLASLETLGYYWLHRVSYHRSYRLYDGGNEGYSLLIPDWKGLLLICELYMSEESFYTRFFDVGVRRQRINDSIASCIATTMSLTATSIYHVLVCLLYDELLETGSTGTSLASRSMYATEMRKGWD